MPLPDASDNRHPQADHRFRSVTVSIIVHLALAAILWTIVMRRPVPVSIDLKSAAVDGDDEVLVQLGEGDANPVPVMDLPGSFRDAQPVAGLEEQLRATRAISIPDPSQLQPGSVEFFGTRAYGKQFVFVLDVSYSMDARGGKRFRRACQELVRSVSQLRPDQSYYVFLFSYDYHPMFYESAIQYVRADGNHAQQLASWLEAVSLGAGTDPRRSLSLARRLDPDAVFLLSDGEFNEPPSPQSETGWVDEQGDRLTWNVFEGVRKKYREIPIHTIAFENPFQKKQMQQIAEMTGGKHRYVATIDHQPYDHPGFRRALDAIEENRLSGAGGVLQYRTRTFYARRFIAAGEFVFAEYLLRPLRDAELESSVEKLVRYLMEIIDREIGDQRLEDFSEATNQLALRRDR